MWHGFPESFDHWLERTPIEGFFDNEALDDLIEQSDSPQPADLR